MKMAYSGFDQTLTYFWDLHNKGVSRKVIICCEKHAEFVTAAMEGYTA